MILGRFIRLQVGIDEPDVEPRTIPRAPGPGVGEVCSTHEAGPLRLCPVSLRAYQGVVVAISGVVDDIARLKDTGGSGVRRVLVRYAGDQVSRRPGVFEGGSPVGRDGEGDGVVPAFEVLAGRALTGMGVALILVVDQRQYLFPVRRIGGVD